MDSVPDLVDYFYNDCAAPHFSRAGVSKTGMLIPPAFTNWRDEQPLDFPVAYYAWNQFDTVARADGAMVGVSCHTGYINPDGEPIGPACLNNSESRC